MRKCWPRRIRLPGSTGRPDDLCASRVRGREPAGADFAGAVRHPCDRLNKGSPFLHPGRPARAETRTPPLFAPTGRWAVITGGAAARPGDTEPVEGMTIQPGRAGRG